MGNFPGSAGLRGWPIGGGVGGGGTQHFLPVWTAADTLGDSVTSQNAGATWTRIDSALVVNAGADPTYASGDPRLWIVSDSISYSPNILGNDIIIQSPAEPAMTFLTDPDGDCTIYYQAAAAAPDTYFRFAFDDNDFQWRIAGNLIFAMEVDRVECKDEIAFRLGYFTTAERDAIVGPNNGMMVYNTSTDKFNILQNSAWQVIDIV